MKRLFVAVFLSVLMISCHATARFYPVRGPLAELTPPPVIVGQASGASYSETMKITGLRGERFQGKWDTVRQPEKSTSTPATLPCDNEMAPVWDCIYGNGFYVAHVLGTRLYGRASLKNENGDLLKVEFFRPEEPGHADQSSIRGSVAGVAKDNKGNVFKVTFS